MPGQESVCPVCDLACETEADVYRHLLVGHRKRALARRLVSEDAQRTPSTA